MRGLGLRSLSHNMGATFARQIVAALLSLLTIVLIARVYGPDGNGAFAVALLLPTLLSSFLNLGVAPANVYHLGSGQVSVRHLLRANVQIFLWLGLFGLAAGAAILNWNAEGLFPGVSPLLLWFALVIFPVSLLNSYLHSIFQGLQQFKPYNMLAILHPAMLLVLVAGLTIFGNRELALLVAAQAGAQLVVLAMTIWRLSPLLEKQAKGELPAHFVKKTLGYGWKAHLSNIMAFVNYKADVFLVNLLMGPAAVGVYVIAVALSEKLWLMSQAVSTVLLPRLAQLSTDEAKRKILTPLIARWVLFITLLAALVVALVAEGLIRFIFGAEYSGALLPLWILLPGIVSLAAARVLANDIAARGRPEWNMYTSVVVVLVNIAGNVILIPPYGLTGAAAATTLAYALTLTLTLMIYCRFSGNRWRESVFVRVGDVRMVRAAITSPNS